MAEGEGEDGSLKGVEGKLFALHFLCCFPLLAGAIRTDLVSEATRIFFFLLRPLFLSYSVYFVSSSLSSSLPFSVRIVEEILLLPSCRCPVAVTPPALSAASAAAWVEPVVSFAAASPVDSAVDVAADVSSADAASAATVPYTGTSCW